MPPIANNKAHFSRLPNELLSEIFVLCKPTFPKVFHDSLPLDLLQVCRRWRDVAQCTARLWTTLQFTFCEKESLQVELRRIVGTWVQRSYPLPISITARVDRALARRFRMGFNGEFANLGEVIREMCDASDRWQDIDVKLPRVYSEPLMNAVQEGSTRCRRLVVDTMYLPLRLSRVPDIPDIQLEGVLTSVEKNVNLSSIRNLTIESLADGDSCIYLILSSPNLEKVRFEFQKRDLSYQGDPVLARELISLDFIFNVDEEEVLEEPPPFAVFQKITAPSLTTLCITESGDTETFGALSTIEDFITRSGCTLQRFLYDDCNQLDNANDRENICSLVNHVSSIEFLDIRISTTSSGYMELLNGLGDLPLLRNFTVSDGDWFLNGDLVEPLKDFAKRRCQRNGGNLEKVILLANAHQPEAAVSLAQEFREMGVGLVTQWMCDRSWE